MTVTPELSAWLGRRREIAEGAKGGGATATRGSGTPTQGGNNSPRMQAGALALGEIEGVRKLWLSFNVVAHQKDVLLQGIGRIRERLADAEGDAIQAGDREALLAEAEALLAKKGASNGHVGAKESAANGDAVNAKENERLLQEIEKLTAENAKLRASGHRQASPSPEEGRSVEGRLRHALNDRNTTTDQLRQAILGVESMVGEARRELEKAEIRDRRAAIEALHAAMAGDDDFKLQCAIDQARLTEVPGDDIAKAEGKLAELRAMTPEQRQAKEREKFLKKQKTEAYHLVKTNNPAKLQECLEAVGDEKRWRDWKDYQGRSLWRFAQQVQASDVLQYLGPLLGETVQSPTREKRNSNLKADAEAAKAAGAAATAAASTPEPPQWPEPSEGTPTAGTAAAPTTPTTENAAAKALEAKASPLSESRSSRPAVSINLLVVPGPTPDKGGASDRDRSPVTPRTVSPRVDPSDPIAVARAKAFRAVVNEDLDSLEEVLDTVEMDVWNTWENKAGEDLLALSQRRSTRGSTVAYTFIAQRLGLLMELQREAFEEQEAVWVFAPGEVQPRRATVKEDTPEDADDILVEFWDGNEEAERVERCLVRKGNA